MGIGVFKAVKPHQVQILLGNLAALGLGDLPVFQTELRVFHGGLPLVKPGFLEHHGNALVPTGNFPAVKLQGT